ncbi:MAG: hypothetical protein MJZ25_08880 [Fibrobacter sp.]|nr:hypothetical protein [Fibrobacter sp.]
MKTLNVVVSGRKHVVTEEIAQAMVDLIDRIDYAYGQCGSDNPYGDMKNGGLAYPVADKVVYIKRLLNDANVRSL